MAELDLSKAVEAGAKARLEQEFPESGWDARDVVCQTFTEQSAQMITAALPHILDAPAEEFERDAIFPDWDQVVAAALRYKARQVRRG